MVKIAVQRSFAMVQDIIFLVRVIFLTAGLIGFSSFYSTAGDDLYTVGSIKLDATAADSNTARSDAISEGQEQGLTLLLKKLTLPKDKAKLPSLTREEVAGYVQDFEIFNERRSDQRYMAELKVRFKREEIRRLLVAAGVPFSEAASIPIVVLPVYREGEAVTLWEDSNPWREAWRRLEIKNEAVSLIVPMGQLADVLAIDVGQALAGDRGPLREFASTYGAGETLVVIATISFSGSNQGFVDVTMQNFGVTVGALEIERFEMAGDETLEGFLLRAAEQMAQRIEYDWKVSNLLSFDEEASIEVVYLVEGWAEWQSIVARLRRVSVVQDVAIVALSRSKANLRIKFLGGIERFALLLQKKDLRLEQEAGNWMIQGGSEEVSQIQGEPVSEPILEELPGLSAEPDFVGPLPSLGITNGDSRNDLFIE
tara:strand:+ start:281 stop:1558 length:1278 start_codon:yes stop_codon:yes gene_type:complete